MSILIFIVVLVFLVLVHEFGHFIVAKKTGMRVDEFGFGFPPKLGGKKFGETEYTINALPLGGFVRIYGENPDEVEDDVDKNRSFGSRPLWAQALVIVAGVTMNMLLAWLVISATWMMGQTISTEGDLAQKYTVTDSYLTYFVTPGSPAAEAGLKTGDEIVKVEAGSMVIYSDEYKTVEGFVADFQSLTADHIDEGVTVVVSDDGHETQYLVKPGYEVAGETFDKPVIGVMFERLGSVQLGPIAALVEGASTTVLFTKYICLGLVDFFSKLLTADNAFQDISGPVGIVSIVGDASDSGLIPLLQIIAIISINLAIINMLPFPALDGGRLVFVMIEAIKGSPIKPQVAGALNAIGFILLMLIMLVVTYHDIVKLFT